MEEATGMIASFFMGPMQLSLMGATKNARSTRREPVLFFVTSCIS